MCKKENFNTLGKFPVWKIEHPILCSPYGVATYNSYTCLFILTSLTPAASTSSEEEKNQSRKLGWRLPQC